MIVAWIIVGFLMTGLWLAGEFVRAPIVSDTGDDNVSVPSPRRRHIADENETRVARGSREKTLSRTRHRGGIRLCNEHPMTRIHGRRRKMHSDRWQFRDDDAPRPERWNPHDQGPRYDL